MADDICGNVQIADPRRDSYMGTAWKDKGLDRGHKSNKHD